ncbi:Retrovirus-related Pol polyprotein from transposon TNT 1-94 [Gossypium australe]|uniref:Retrovirus-related Pol polyprotein from transposon TNT 1-94 n=1 Tax=Gossypium australe TaxID=47621 RepID=A0A5B6VY03_9ROSI|nr:Retrovirus-related Pol polyprotein from transposon TNT 1-94 [Gossypium australe]
MEISRDRRSGKLLLLKQRYIKKILRQFEMQDSKLVSTPLGADVILSISYSPQTEHEERYMSKVPYSSAIESLMYAMVCTRPDISHIHGQT